MDPPYLNKSSWAGNLLVMACVKDLDLNFEKFLGQHLGKSRCTRAWTDSIKKSQVELDDVPAFGDVPSK
jgi:hypothetical protein